MVDVTPVLPKGVKQVQAYGREGFTVSGMRYEEALCVLPEQVQPLAIDMTAPEFLPEHLDLLDMASQPVELLLIGSGKRAQPISLELRDACRARHIAVEVMDTGAACRTYNVLLAEGRRMAVWLLPVA